MLDEEIGFYKQNLAQWLTEHHGKFALIHGRQLVGMFNTNDEALIEGARLFGLSSFLVRPVLPDEQVVNAPALTLGLLGANTPHTGSSAGD